jgi:ADP-ribosyl-[dinitrogen reductase] hydrolase
MNTPAQTGRILGALWGSAVGDALGVPVEFTERERLRKHPVTDLRGFGSHNQPPGTWSDDTSLMLCSLESLLEGFEPQAMGQKFVSWYRHGLWTAHNEVFDIGGATRQALARIEAGVPAERAGGRDIHSNGNGSLMRMLPIPLLFHNAPTEKLLEHTHRASAITHGHPRSLVACGYFSLLVRELLHGCNPQQAYAAATQRFKKAYAAEPFVASLGHFELLTNGKLAEQPEEAIPSSGYVVHTLMASVWCLLNSTSFPEAVLKAVNLGSDTDTTGTVTGGLAGLFYGLEAVPEKWRRALAREKDLEELFGGFLAIVEQT